MDQIEIPGLSGCLAVSNEVNIAVLRLSRPERRDALDSVMIPGIETFFSFLPNDIPAAIIQGEGDHFCA
jgi:enoyl-CoA hydratase/carnithine racemase